MTSQQHTPDIVFDIESQVMCVDIRYDMICYIYQRKMMKKLLNVMWKVVICKNEEILCWELRFK